MKNLVFALFIFISAKSFAQDTITTAQVKDYLGKEVWVKGTVASFKPAGENSLNYINVDKAFPQNIFTVVIADKYLQRLKIDLTKSKGKKILVKGKIEGNGKDTPQIVNPVKVVIK
ncbi:hypothetical protein [Flavobacterium sp. 3HN19-14]|uniref:hypothetical protein n=1 Tax=Flavobacterium sp. 3HN19-14 TaxID=3448133 RepID=UPI003EE05E29